MGATELGVTYGVTHWSTLRAFGFSDGCNKFVTAWSANLSNNATHNISINSGVLFI